MNDSENTMEGTNSSISDYDVLVTLHHDAEVNRPWLENQAMKIEQAILERCENAPGSSVTANFEENGWELDLTILAGGMAQFYDRLGQVMRVVEEAAEIDLNGKQDEIRSGFESPAPPKHQEQGLVPA